MTATLTQVVKQFQQDWTSQLEPDAILTACRGVAYRWRERTLDPVTTIQLFFVQILHGNTACTHLRHLTKLDVTASAYCQARMKLPLAVFVQLLRSVSHALQHHPLDEGRWLGHRTFWVDGSSFSMPDTPALQEHFGQPGHNSPGVVSLLRTCWRCFMPGLGWSDTSWRPPCAPMIFPRWSDSIRTCAPAMSWWPTEAFVPLPIWPCWCRQVCMPSSACIRNTSWTSPRASPCGAAYTGQGPQRPAAFSLAPTARET